MASSSTLRSWLRLVRLPLAPTAAWDAAACLALALAFAGRGLDTVEPLDWILLLATSLLVYAAGMAANDLADRRRDAELAPTRPIPAGEIRPRGALVLVLLLAGGAVALGGGRAGSREAVICAVLFAALYDFRTKRSLVDGALTMGLVRFANASIGVFPLVEAGLAPVTALLGPVAVGTYSAAVTVLSTTEEVDAPRRRIVTRVLATLAFVGAGLLPWLAVGRPTLAVVVAFGAATSIAFARTPKPGPAKRQVLEMLLGLYFLSFCLATAGDGGSMAVNLAALGIAFALIWASQMLIRALR
jgi:4-hydroxybenzoate polyprenyltransferase